MLLPALNKCQQPQVTACMANVKQLMNAWVLYANDNRGHLVYAETSAADYTNVDVTKRHPDGWVIDILGDPASAREVAVRAGARALEMALGREVPTMPASTDDDIFRTYSITPTAEERQQYQHLHR